MIKYHFFLSVINITNQLMLSLSLKAIFVFSKKKSNFFFGIVIFFLGIALKSSLNYHYHVLLNLI